MHLYTHTGKDWRGPPRLLYHAARREPSQPRRSQATAACLRPARFRRAEELSKRNIYQHPWHAREGAQVGPGDQGPGSLGRGVRQAPVRHRLRRAAPAAHGEARAAPGAPGAPVPTVARAREEPTSVVDPGVNKVVGGSFFDLAASASKISTLLAAVSSSPYRLDVLDPEIFFSRLLSSS